MCLRERSPLGLKELTKWVSLGSADSSEIHDTNHYRTLKSLGYSCDGQEGLLVPSPGHTGHTGSLRTSYIHLYEHFHLAGFITNQKIS